ncbi:MAG: ThuA domain-containing protein [Bryobacteraceae bacterium]|nr:ThuA domain-containing protein [Bryobacteraceae bacterium]
MSGLTSKLAILAIGSTLLLPSEPGDRTKDRVLVFTRNGKGYVHANIPASVEAIRNLAAERSIEVEASDDPNSFSDDNLRRFNAIVFSNSNNDVFTEEAQRLALQKFVREGGGIVGIHVATGTERNWPWFAAMMGGRFVRHPKLQKFTVRVTDRSHPATKDLPETFEWEDECYYHDSMNPDVRILLTTESSKLEDPKKSEFPGENFKGPVPLSWYHEYGGGRQYYVGLGHKDEHYSNPILRQQILGGLLWAAGVEKTPQR